MRRSAKLPELLAPAGDFECLVAAVAAGADAIYVGGKSFSARAYAKNFDIEELTRAVNYCHLHGVKLYVTINTLLYDSEVLDALNFARELYAIGVDALIVADVGLISLIRKFIPDFELHASTQMSVHNSPGADEAYRVGLSRVVLAREVKGENIKAITEKCLAETEVFVHGALCVCHSGQCLFSSMVGGRSGNRGECAQPCRLPYSEGYPLSLSDLSLSGHIKELIDSGVASLKIEGRMKSPSYVHTVVSIYRRLLDEYRNSSAKEVDSLRRAFSRGKFTDGYFTGKTERGMTGVRSEEDKRATKELGEAEFLPEKIKVDVTVELHLGERSKITLLAKDGRRVTVFGEVPEAAKSSPLSETGVRERIQKTGNTFLIFENIEIILDGGINLSPAKLNALRRSACEAFGRPDREVVEEIRKEDLPRVEISRVDRRVRSACFFSAELYNNVNKDLLKYFDELYIPLSSVNEASAGFTGVYLPPVIMEDELDEVRELLSLARSEGVKGALIGNIGHIPLVKEFELIPLLDFRMNIMNSYTKDFYSRAFGDRIILSPELTEPQARDIGGGAVVYGRIPLMLTERCFMRENFGCEKCSDCSLTDRRGVKFPIIREFKHRNLILNSAVTYLGDRGRTLQYFDREHYLFTVESPYEVERIIKAYKKGEAYPLSNKFRRMGKRQTEK